MVERPASVIKELIENSLDAGATKIVIEVEKGGIKKLRISDDGCGIAKDELTLALSRHATSKIKNLKDLEGISSLGFRGEALASISSVSRLTLTSKTKLQDTAWQASAEGRDMEVSIQPAAHPDGTTIEVNDLFFNTPARRKFLRTEKTEFTHIDEIIRRIALARFDVSFSLSNNGKLVRQYRAARDKSFYDKRVAMICGQRFLEQAIAVDNQHDNLHLWGWLAKPSYYRSQNDLSYTYVNGRMMRDKLINHAIRQAYADLLPSEGYPAFVLFLTLDFREVDVNVHPAKHEVRFHQGRYIHDYIYSVCHQALVDEPELFEQKVIDEKEAEKKEAEEPKAEQPTINQGVTTPSGQMVFSGASEPQSDAGNTQSVGGYAGTVYGEAKEAGIQSYIKPLTRVSDSHGSYGSSTPRGKLSPSADVVKTYQELMTVYSGAETQNTGLDSGVNANVGKDAVPQLLYLQAPAFGVFVIRQELRLVSLTQLAQKVHCLTVLERWSQGLISQPLLLPVLITLSEQQYQFVCGHQQALKQAGIIFIAQDKLKIQIREFPAILRQKDISGSLLFLLEYLVNIQTNDELTAEQWCQGIAVVLAEDVYAENSALALLIQAQTQLGENLESQLLLNSVVIDLTSGISQLS